MEVTAEEKTASASISQASVSEHHINKIATPVTPIEYPEAVRFQVPAESTFTIGGSIASILSLVFMSVMSTLMFLALAQNDLTVFANLTPGDGLWGQFVALFQQANTIQFSAWVWLPFAFTIFGSVVGWMFELGLLLTGTPFQTTRTKLDQFITQVRLLNLAPVTATIFFFIAAMTVESADLRTGLLFVSAAFAVSMGFALFFGSRSPVVQLGLLGIQVVQIAVVLAYGSQLGSFVMGLLISQSVLQLVSLLTGTSTPAKSTVFHVVSTIAGILLFVAIVSVSATDPGFSSSVAPDIVTGSLLMWGLVGISLVALVATAKLLPDAYNNFRMMLSASTWVPIYFKLVSAERFPNPVKLSEVYRDSKPKITPLKPYYLAHPEHLIQALSIPAICNRNIEANVTVYKKLLDQAAGAFKLIAFLDHSIPQADSTKPLKNKPRMAIWSNGKEYWPGLFKKKIFGATLPNGGVLQNTPRVALNAYKEGQLLAYLAESGVANPFLKKAEGRGDGALMMDFRFLEKYETKADYESYGGVAYFRVNALSESLGLVLVVAPHTIQEIAANPHDPAFRHAEQLVLASMYYQVISGKHLAEIHMTYNLVEVSMHNAFDAKGQWTHPFRTFMYLHFFSHELAEEMTTEHLIQEGAVFTQIFATTHDALINHLNDCYADFKYGDDEDIEARTAAMTMPNGKLLPNSCIKWEREYFDVWQRYTSALINIIYPDDQSVRDDNYLQDFYNGLLQVLMNGLPARYEEFQTKKGVARFAADTIHHMVIRHQVYGTTGIRAALDPRISSTQVPKDTGTPGVDEWRSLAFVALATGEARFTLLTGEKGKDFSYLLDGIDETYRKPMAKVFSQLQIELLTLDEKWTEGVVETDFNENYFRAIPSALHTGPGY